MEVPHHAVDRGQIFRELIQSMGRPDGAQRIIEGHTTADDFPHDVEFMPGRGIQRADQLGQSGIFFFLVGEDSCGIVFFPESDGRGNQPVLGRE